MNGDHLAPPSYSSVARGTSPASNASTLDLSQATYGNARESRLLDVFLSLHLSNARRSACEMPNASAWPCAALPIVARLESC